MSDNYEKFKGLYSSKDWDYETPIWLFDSLKEIFDFQLDAAANEFNTKCDDFIDEEKDALLSDWKSNGYWWLNPPWGREYKKYSGYTIDHWMNHALQQYQKGNEGVAIVSARTDTKWWHNNVRKAPFVLFPKGRVAFLIDNIKKNQPNFPSALVIYVDDLSGDQINMLNEIGWLVQSVTY